MIILSARRMRSAASFSTLAALCLFGATVAGAADPRPNIVLIMADDMGYSDLGCYGSEIATPNIDRLAAEGMRFAHAHVTIAVCQPSRSALMTGRYPHRSGGEGFWHLRRAGVPTLPEILRAAGYRVGILGKVGHSTPYAEFAWDLVHDQDALGYGRNPAIYRAYAEGFFAEAAAAQAPFFLMLNSHDPHRPFYGNDAPRIRYEGGERPPAAKPSRVFAPEEVVTPGFLPDLPAVRQEIAEYYSSVKRCDDTVGAVLAALEEQGLAENTLVMFLSDNGMAFPFSKTNCYLHSTRTPWIVRWPARLRRPGRVDEEHFISGIDFLPTALEAAGIASPAGVDGRSFLPLLEDETQSGREQAFTQFHQTAGKRNYPMRCVQTRTFGYIWNAWSDGERIFRNESQSGRTFAAMQEAARESEAIAARVRHFLYRVPEELYDFQADPHALRNLAEDPAHAETLARMRAQLAAWMEATGDPARAAFRDRDDPRALAAFMEAAARDFGGE